MNMRIAQPLTISFEFFPPKSKEGVEDLLTTAKILSHYHPNFFSVTFGAGGTTRDGTIEVVKMLQQHTNMIVAPHLSCIGFKREDILSILRTYNDLGIKHVVALRGDLPSGMGVIGEYQYASELVALIREVTGDYFHIEVAAYPEVHPQAISAEDDIRNLKRKFDAGANSAITQYFFNPDAYFKLLNEAERENIYMPIVPGIMPITHYVKLLRFSEMCGAEVPRWIRKRLEPYSDDVATTTHIGLEIVYELCESLIEGGAPGLHFYTLNKADITLRLLEALKINSYKMPKQDTWFRPMEA